MIQAKFLDYLVEVLQESGMPWNTHLFSSVALLVFLQGQRINGASQESVYVIECIRDMIPMQIFNECCLRENNCSVTRQQNKGIDCMSRMIMSNYSYMFGDSHDGGSQTTEMPYQYRQDRNHNWHMEVLESLAEICKRQPKGKLQTCIRNELIKRCRYSMLQDRITSPPGRWNQRNHRDHNYGGEYYGGGGDNMEPRRGVHQLYGGSRRNQADGGYYQNGRQQGYSDYGDNSRHFSRGNHNREEADEEDFGYSDGDSRYKY